MCGAWEEGLSGSLLLAPDNAIECVVHGCDVLNTMGFTRPYVLSEHTFKMQCQTCQDTRIGRDTCMQFHQTPAHMHACIITYMHLTQIKVEVRSL